MEVVWQRVQPFICAMCGGPWCLLFIPILSLTIRRMLIRGCIPLGSRKWVHGWELRITDVRRRICRRLPENGITGRAACGLTGRKLHLLTGRLHTGWKIMKRCWEMRILKPVRLWRLCWKRGGIRWCGNCRSEILRPMRCVWWSGCLRLYLSLLTVGRQ